VALSIITQAVSDTGYLIICYSVIVRDRHLKVSRQVVEDDDLQSKLLTADHSVRQIQGHKERLEHHQLTNTQTHTVLYSINTARFHYISTWPKKVQTSTRGPEPGARGAKCGSAEEGGVWGWAP